MVIFIAPLEEVGLKSRIIPLAALLSLVLAPLAAQGVYLVGEPVKLVVTVENPTEAALSYRVVLIVNGEAVNQTDVFVEPGSSASVELSWTPDAPGTYELRVEVRDESGALAKVETYEIEVVEPPKPDLSVIDLSVAPEEFGPGENIEVSVTVTNQGDAGSPSTSVVVTEEPTGRVVYVGEVGPLPPGGEEVISFEYSVPEEPGNYSLVVVLDPENEVEERDEANRFEFGISIPPPTQAPPTQVPPSPTETAPPATTPTTPPPPSPSETPSGTQAPTTGGQERGGVEWYAYALGLLAAASLLTYAVLRSGWVADPCRDLTSLRRSLDAARGAKSKLLDELDRIRREADQISREISGLESSAGSVQAELRAMWRERDDLKLGKLPKVVLIGEDRVIVRVGERLRRLRELEEKIPEMENRLAGLRSQILERESALDAKLREADRLWSRVEEANRRVEEANDLIYECLSKLKGPCDDLDLLRSRISELERELEAMRALISLSEGDVKRLERAIRQAREEIESQLKTARTWEEAAEGMRAGRPRWRIKVRGLEMTDVDFRLIKMEENMLAARLAEGEISESEFLRDYQALNPPTREAIEELRKRARDAASRLEARAREARERARSLEAHVDDLRGMRSAAEARTESLREKAREISDSLEKARKRLDECERRVRDCLSALSRLRAEIRSTLRSYRERRAELIQDARSQIEAVDGAVEETPDLVGRIQRLAADVRDKVERIQPVAKLEELGPEFQKIIEDDWNAFSYGKTAASVVKNVAQLLKDIGAKADSILPDPSDYLEPAVKGVAFLYRVAGVMLSPTNEGAWLYREMRRWEEEGRVPSDEEIMRVLDDAERFREAWHGWRRAMREALEALQGYLEAVRDGQDVRGDWQRFLECLEGLPDEPLSADELDELEGLLRESTTAATLSDCERYRRLLRNRLEEIGERTERLIDACEEPGWRPGPSIESARSELLQAAERLEGISRDLQRYLDSVGRFIRSVMEGIPGFIRAILEALS